MFLGFSLGCFWALLLFLSSAVCRPAAQPDGGYPYSWGPRTQFQPGVQSVKYQSASPPVLPPSQDYFPIGPGPVTKPKWQSGPHYVPAPWVPAPSGSSQMGFYPEYPYFPEGYFIPFMMGEGQSASSESFRRGPPFQSPYSLGRDPDLFIAAQPQSAPGGFPNVELASAASFLFPENPVRPDPDDPVPSRPLPPPSRIIQSSNGFMRVAHKRSRAKYSPDSFEESVEGVDPLAFLSASDPRSDQKV